MHAFQLEAFRAPVILVLADTPEIQLVLCRLLRDVTHAHDIVIVSSVDQALAQLAARSVQVLITKDAWPNTAGLTLTTTVKQRSPQTQVILIAERTPDSLDGVDHYLSRQLLLDHLEAIVRATINEA